MLKDHPKGLLVAFFANMGERFGFYTMMAILVLFLKAKYGMSDENAGFVYSTFYFSIYGLALVGGFIADRIRNYKGTILAGIVTMLAGYVLMAMPGLGMSVSIGALFVIAFGNGLFKGNLQAVVGQLYDDPRYAHKRDSAFSIFYMGINIGAFFAPSAATGIRNWTLAQHNLGYDADLPSLCHQFLSGALESTDKFVELATKAKGAPVSDLTAFAQEYIDVFGTGYHYAFGIAACAMLVSMVVFVLFQRKLPRVQKHGEGGTADAPRMAPQEERQRLIALGLVFAVVIFFWMAFHQNGLTLTLFAKDYTAKSVDALSNMFFDIKAFLAVIGVVLGLVLLVRKSSSAVTRLIGLGLMGGCGALSWYFYQSFGANNTIEPEKFQHFNPIFIVFLTPVVVGLFGWLNKRGIEPSTPKKIGIGMIITAMAFVVMVIASLGLPSQTELGGQPSPERVSPYWLIDTYLMLTIAELFLSPMGISFVSKVSPPRFQGLMQGGWLAATALGNQLLFVGSLMYANFEVWQVWLVFIVCCLLAAGFIFSVMKKLEAATADKPVASDEAQGEQA